jgi:uncharacterized membrane protein YqjE
MPTDPGDFTEDLPDPGWKERLGAIRRAARALFATRVEIFREEIAEKGSLLGRGLAGLSLALAFAGLSLVLATALVAAILARLLGGPIAGLAATLFLYAVITGAAALFGIKKLRQVRPFVFPITRNELRKDLEAVREEGTLRDEEPASPEILAAERASLRPGDDGDRDQDEERNRSESDLEERFRAGSE